MKIFFASQSFYPLIGGVSTYLINLATGLKEKGHSVAEIHLRPPFEQSEGEVKGINVYRVPREPLNRELLEKYAHFKECVYKECHGEEKCFDKPVEETEGYSEYLEINEEIGKQVAELLTGHPATIAHVHDFQLLLLHKHVPRGIPLVFTWHIPFPKAISENLKEFLISNLKEFDKVIFSTQEYIRNAVAAGLPREKAAHIYPIMNTRLFKPIGEKDRYRKKYKIPLKAKTILCVQRIDPKSGHEQLIKAMPFVLKKVPEARLVFVGSESMSTKISNERQKYEYRVKALIKRLGLGRKVIFTGNIDYEKMPEIYATADVVALTSKQEGFGLAVTEGMACGKAVIGTRIPGIMEQVEHGKNGYLVRVGDYKKTAGYIVKILLNENKRKKMEKLALEKVKKKFSMELGITNHIKLYNKLLREKSRLWSLEMLKLEDVSAIAVDFDRTLADKPGKINERAFRKLKSLKKPLLLVTGRNTEFCRSLIKKQRGFSAVVAENGSVVIFPKSKQTIVIDSDQMRDAREKLAGQDYSFGEVIVSAPLSKKNEIRKKLGSIKGLKFVKNIDRVMLCPKNNDKGTGTMLALYHLEKKAKKTILIGDGENDVQLFNVPGFRVAVQNAVPKLKALADQVMKKNGSSGIIEAIEKLCS